MIVALTVPTEAGAGDRRRLPTVDRAIEYHGGRAFVHSETRFELCSKSGCSEVRSRVTNGLYENEVTAVVRGKQRRVLTTNDTVERWEDGEQLAVEDDIVAQRLRDWVMQRIYFSFLPYRLNDPSVLKEDLGFEEWDGRRLRKVKVTFEPGTSTDWQDQYLFWFDPAEGRLEMYAYSYLRDEGGLRFRRLFNYRRVGGILFCDQQNWGAEGKGLSVDSVTPDYVHTAMRHISTVELTNIEVDLLD
jgi:hypothetical protein